MKAAELFWPGTNVWKMYKYYEAFSRAKGLSLLRVNADQTSIGLVQKPLKGMVMRLGERARDGACEDARVSKSPPH